MCRIYPSIDSFSSKIIDEFCRAQNWTIGTEKRYLSVYRSFLSFIKFPLLQASSKELYDYYMYLETSGLSLNTIKIHSAALTNLYSWLYARKYITKDVCLDLGTMKTNFYLNETLFIKLKKSLETRPRTLRTLRDSILLHLLYLGLTITMISQLSRSSYQSPHLIVGNRRIILEAEIRKTIEIYLSMCQSSSNSLLVAHHQNPAINGQPLSFFSTYKSFENMFLKAGIKFRRLRDCI
jgi:site-specific recombinase XerD